MISCKDIVFKVETAGQFRPACFKMLLTVPFGKSFLGCGIVTNPFGWVFKVMMTS